MTNKEIATMIEGLACDIYDQACPELALHRGDSDECTRRTGEPKTWIEVVSILRDFASQIDEIPDDKEFKPVVQIVVDNKTHNPEFASFDLDEDTACNVWRQNHNDNDYMRGYVQLV